MAFCHASNLNITLCIKHILTHFKGDLSTLTSEDIDSLLDETPDFVDEQPRSNIVGYPARPLYRDIGNMIQIWFDAGVCPLTYLPTFELLDEKEYAAHRVNVIEHITPLLKRLKSLFTVWSDDEILHILLDIVQCLGKRGLLDLIGMRKTVGTVEIWPPPRQLLCHTFQQLNNSNSDSVLTVGARALAKHCHRDQTKTWWGVAVGSESVKNNHAFSVMNKILDGAIWINIHQLPHDVNVIEARQENGYGARWTADGLQFRGFLEPQMVDGHEMHWRH